MPNQVAYYKKAIDIITHNRMYTNPTNTEVAKNNPSKFIRDFEQWLKELPTDSSEFCEQVASDSTLSLDAKLTKLIQAGLVINAIKLYRNESHLSLMDSKDYIVKLQEKLSKG